MSMKIGINLTCFEHEKIDGVGYMLKGLLRQLLNHQEHRYLLFVLEGFDYQKVFGLTLPDNMEVVKVSRPRGILAKLYLKLVGFSRTINACAPDVFYSPVPPIPFFIKTKIGVVTTIHDLIPLIVKAKMTFIPRCYFRFIVWYALRRSDRVIAISENTKKDLIRLYSVPAGKISVVYVALADYKQEISTKEEPYFLTVSTIQPCKNLERLFRAFSLVLANKDWQGMKLYVIGRKGWDYQKIMDLPAELGIADHVHFTGYLSDPEKEQYYRNCLAMVYVSLYEGFGIPPLEALCHGKPVIASNVSSLPEVVGEAGILVNPLEETEITQALKLILNRQIRANLVSKIPAQLKKFEPGLIVDKWLAVFKEAKRN